MKSVSALVFAASLSMATAALAQSTADISVSGTLTPAACMPTLAGGGNFNFGNISVQDLDQEAYTSFRSAPRQLSVACNAPTRFALRVIDGRAGTQPIVTIDNFGLGLSGVERIGEYHLVTKSYSADGNASIDVVTSSDGGASWVITPQEEFRLFNTNGANLTGIAVAGGGEPSAIGTLTADLIVQMAIAPAKSLTLTSEVNIDGAATLEVVYL